MATPDLHDAQMLSQALEDSQSSESVSAAVPLEKRNEKIGVDITTPEIESELLSYIVLLTKGSRFKSKAHGSFKQQL